MFFLLLLIEITMDLRIWVNVIRVYIVFLIIFLSASTVYGIGGGVFKVQHKFSNYKERSLAALKEHDGHRHGRNLAGVDFPLHGNGSPTGTGLYYTKIGIGSPSNDYYVQVDTGSDIFWVKCIGCDSCPKTSDLGIDLRLYNPHSSATGKIITCDEGICEAVISSPGTDCVPGDPCSYVLPYGDGSKAGVYLVKDLIQYDRVSGNLQTTSANASVMLGCAVAVSGNFMKDDMATDGIIGFGQASTSLISQLASAKMVKKVFAHCLDSKNGGGIFAIGNVVKPKVSTTPLVPNQPHYNVNLKTIQVGKDIIPTDVFGNQTVIDSGTTLAYIPKQFYDQLISKILAGHSDLQVKTVEDSFLCFQYDRSVDDDFPVVTFQFENSLSLAVYPHEYLFQVREYGLCIGWQSSEVFSEEMNDMTLLGDLVLSNKLVVYDLEKQALGWTEYNCSSTIELQDDQSGSSYQVGAKKPPSPTTSAGSLFKGRFTMMVLLVSMLLSLIY